MTTQIPTKSDGAPRLESGAVNLDELAAMANALFRALPGTEPVLSAPRTPAGVSAPESAPALPEALSLNATEPVLSEPTRGQPFEGYESLAGGSAVVQPAYYFVANIAEEAQRYSGNAASPAVPSVDLSMALPEAYRGLPRTAPGAAPQFYFLDSLSTPFGGEVPTGLVVPGAARPFNVQEIRRDFPILSEKVNGRPLVWFDNAATTHKPTAVIDRISYFYQHENSNIHRAAHELAARSTDAYEDARKTVARFIGAGSPDEIIFVRGATEAINLLAETFGRQYIGKGDEIIVSLLEHHANIVPWYQLAQETGAKLRVIPVDDTGQILLDEYRKLLNGRTKLVAVTQVSNALGTITPVADIIAMAHGAGVPVLVDGAQAVSHMPVDVQALDADFYVFSGHKVFGPTGIGVIYGKKEWLEKLPPWQGGGNMIEDVTFDHVRYQGVPSRFEAGTGNIADAVGLGAALKYLEQIGMENIARYEHDLLAYATEKVRNIPGLRLVGTAKDKASVLSFVLDGYSTEEVGTELNREGVAVRAGHHCAQPILRRFGLETTVRPSLAFYNTCEEVDLFASVVDRLARARR